MTYFDNGANLTVLEKKSGEKRAESQDMRIMEHAKLYPDREFTPFDFLDEVFNNSIPITSVRRSLTNLTTSGLLDKTENKRKEQYGENNHTWKLAQAKRVLQEELF